LLVLKERELVFAAHREGETDHAFAAARGDVEALARRA
jgi:hypothetical protein